MYQQVADNITKMANDSFSFQRRSVHVLPISEEPTFSSNERKSCSKMNESSILGHYNATVQLGNANWSTTKGDTNKTQQLGNRNKSLQDGNGNQTVQIAPDSINLWYFMEMLRLGAKYLLNF